MRLKITFRNLSILFFLIFFQTVLFARDYGKVEVNSQIDNLNVYIDGVFIEKIKKGKKLVYKLDGNHDFGDYSEHEILVRKDINEEKELLFTYIFSFNVQGDIKEHPVRVFNFVKDEPTIEQTLKKTHFMLEESIKKDVIAKRNGLLQKVKLLHNGASNMKIYKNKIYILTRAKNDLISKKRREKDIGEFIEIYSLNDVKLLKELKLNDKSDKLFYSQNIEVDENSIYLGTKEVKALVYDKKKPLKDPKVLNGYSRIVDGEEAGFFKHEGAIRKIKRFGEYLFTLGDSGKLMVYKKNKFLYEIDVRRSYDISTNDLLRHPYLNKVSDVFLHGRRFYVATEGGYINEYATNSGLFIRSLVKPYFKRIKDFSSNRIRELKVFNKKFIVYSKSYSGIGLYDLRKKESIYISKSLYPARVEFSEIFGKIIDRTKRSNVQKFVLYKRYMIFTEYENKIVVYDLKNEKMVHKYNGLEDNIVDLSVKKDKLYSLGDQGNLYIWDLNIFKKEDTSY